ncbi:hypothetical protein [Caulobacter sp. NIBR2454]|uniref:hypothetical protein n=1 Tax=Caulobacter sp. NIBR2454 TaxID=3015996 RepID=UPI0022B74A1B|nr:hypothetical protein [Caulobacter sp. NIBR2454]
MIFDELGGRLDELRQPRLYQRIAPNMIGNDGLPEPSATAGVDALIAEYAVRQIFTWDMPTDLRVPASASDRWLAISSLQKAIRFGNVPAAMNAAHMAHCIDPRGLWRRLVVCAMEDVLLGNLFGVSSALALIGDKASRRLAGDRKAAVWLACILAAGWKDRTACNLTTIVDFDRSLHPKMDAWSRLSDEVLAANASDMGSTTQDRMLATWLLAGTKRYWNVNVPVDNDRPRSSLMRLMVEQQMPLLLYWIADRAAVRGGDCLFVSLLPVWQILRDGPVRFELRSSEPKREEHNGFLAAAFDMHTREGQSALRAFVHHPPVAAALDAVPPCDRRALLFVATFLAEGGRLNLRLSCPEMDALHLTAMTTELAYFGSTSLKHQVALLGVVERNIDVLNQMRVNASKRGEATGAYLAGSPPPQDRFPHQLQRSLALSLLNGPIAPNPRPLPITPDFDLADGVKMRKLMMRHLEQYKNK